jgi:hypothetical protein
MPSRALHGLAQHGDVADVVGQQQDQARVEPRALFVAQARWVSISNW